MKRIYVFISAALSLLSGASCSAYLDESPKDRLDEETAYSTLSDVQRNGVLSLYNYVGGYVDSQGLQGTGRGIYDLNTFTTDEAMMPTRGGDWYDGGFWQGLYLHRWGVNNEAIYATWEYLYRTVILCNGSLEKIQAFSAAHPTEEVAPLVAEVRALRAMFYYYIMDLFGSVPLIEKSSPALEEIVQEKRSKVFYFIVKELMDSEPFLSLERSNQPGVYYGYYFLELADYFGREGTDEKEMMNLLYVTVKALMNQQLDNRLIRCIYELRTMVEQGLCPQLFQCTGCEKEISDGEDCFFSQEMHGILCISCALGKRDARRISPSALYAMRYIATAPMGRLYSFRVEPEVLLELEQIIHLYTARNTDRKFKSLQILEVMK